MLKSLRCNDSKFQKNLLMNIQASEAAINQRRMMGVRSTRAEVMEYRSLASTRVRPVTPAALETTFQDRIHDESSLSTLMENQARGPESVHNRYSRQKKWHDTLNCPYFGLVQLRKT